MAKASSWRPWLLTVVVVAVACTAIAEPLLSKSIGQLNVPEIEDALQVSIHLLVTTPNSSAICQRWYGG